MNDLRAITNVTGDEYNMFTFTNDGSAQRLVVRGTWKSDGSAVINVSQDMYNDMMAGKYGKFSGHTHPPVYGVTPGSGDQPFLEALAQTTGQTRSGIWGTPSSSAMTGNVADGIHVYGTRFQDPLIQAELRAQMFKKIYGE